MLLLRVQGMVLSGQERWDEAEAVFNEGVSLAHDMPYPYAEARILFEHGVMRFKMSKSQRARSRLTEALAIFQRPGARTYIELAKRALGAL